MAAGHPHYRPQEWTEAQWIERLSWLGTPNKRIAELLGIDEKTLVKHHGESLTKGREGRLATLAQTAYERAMDRDDKDSAKLLTLCLATRGGWTTTQKTEISGPEGGPQLHKMVDGPPQETYEQWASRRARIASPAPLPTKLLENDPDD